MDVHTEHLAAPKPQTCQGKRIFLFCKWAHVFLTWDLPSSSAPGPSETCGTTERPLRILSLLCHMPTVSLWAWIYLSHSSPCVALEQVPICGPGRGHRDESMNCLYKGLDVNSASHDGLTPCASLIFHSHPGKI